MALFTLFCRRPTTKALFNFTARRVLSVAALRTESDTTGGAESSARPETRGGGGDAQQQQRQRRGRKRHEDKKKLRWLDDSQRGAPAASGLRFFRLPSRLRDSAVRQRTKSAFLANPTYCFIDGTKLKLFTLPSNSSSTNHRFSTSFFPHGLRSIPSRASAHIQCFSFFAFTSSPFPIISMIVNSLSVKASPI